MSATLRYIEYEPRWHGWARWALEIESPGESGGTTIVVLLQEGWKRRPRGSQFVEIPPRPVPSRTRPRPLDTAERGPQPVRPDPIKRGQ